MCLKKSKKALPLDIRKNVLLTYLDPVIRIEPWKPFIRAIDVGNRILYGIVLAVETHADPALDNLWILLLEEWKSIQLPRIYLEHALEWTEERKQYFNRWTFNDSKTLKPQ